MALASWKHNITYHIIISYRLPLRWKTPSAPKNKWHKWQLLARTIDQAAKQRLEWWFEMLKKSPFLQWKQKLEGEVTSWNNWSNFLKLPHPTVGNHRLEKGHLMFFYHFCWGGIMLFCIKLPFFGCLSRLGLEICWGNSIPTSSMEPCTSSEPLWLGIRVERWEMLPSSKLTKP